MTPAPFITCQNPACGRQKQVRRACDVKVRRFCSLRCAGLHRRVWVTCETCGKRTWMRPSLAKIRRFCSRPCANAANSTQSRLITASPEERRVWWLKGQATRRRQALARLAGLSVVEAFNRGYSTGYKAGQRYMKKWAR